MVVRLHGKFAAQSEQRFPTDAAASRHPPLGEHLDSEARGSMRTGVATLYQLMTSIFSINEMMYVCVWGHKQPAQPRTCSIKYSFPPL